MMAKGTAMTAAARDRLLAQTWTDGFELSVSWSPGRDQPVTIFLLRVNGMKLAHDEVDTDSPFAILKLPAPDNGAFTIDFSIKPEVSGLQIMIISIRNRRTGAYTIVAKKDLPKSGDVWMDVGVTTNAP